MVHGHAGHHGQGVGVGSETRQLLLERARRLVPDLTLDAAGAAALARICRRLDGLPLALEAGGDRCSQAQAPSTTPTK